MPIRPHLSVVLMLPITLFLAVLAATGAGAQAPAAGAQAPVAGAKATGGNPEARKIKNPVPPTASSLAAGAATYKKYCSFCHGDDATGDGALAPKNSHPPDLTDDETTHGSSDGEVFTLIQTGADPSNPKAVMKAFKGKITDQDTWNVVNYLRSLHRSATR